MMFAGCLHQSFEWSEAGLEGASRFLRSCRGVWTKGLRRTVQAGLDTVHSELKMILGPGVEERSIWRL